ncbi:MAG: HAMP domain-containing sensor histidine kinase [Bacteroidales bacterium]|nr:HAMP domain-containing sensor histidine kinase [Bacteroidales bacterium]
MKKWSIWLLSFVMAFAFVGLLTLQVMYAITILDTRNENFREAVERSLRQVNRNLELDETRAYLLREVFRESDNYFAWGSEHEQKINDQYFDRKNKYVFGKDSLLWRHNLEMGAAFKSEMTDKNKFFPSRENSIEKTSRNLQELFQQRFYYQKGLLDEVILEILYRSSLDPIEERVDLRKINEYIRSELANNGLLLPFHYKVLDKDGKEVYRSVGFKDVLSKWTFTQPLFENDRQSKKAQLVLYFPIMRQFLVSSVSFIIPSMIFTVILLITFITTIVIISRQKRLSELKSDFVSNMTHELKTPVSTISLAVQMLKDADVTKSPELFKHISTVIYDETKRLSFLIEKVLQTSLYEKQKATLKLKELDVNDLIVNIANTMHLKVEQVGGTLDIELNAIESTAMLDEMHITNVVFNLMDNAIKYRKPDVPLQLMARTWNDSNKLYISIEDNGVGIKKEYQKKVFDRFFRVPKGNRHDVKGFGLGLAYVKKIITDLNGGIKVESEFNVGTKFIIYLPFVK